MFPRPIQAPKSKGSASSGSGSSDTREPSVSPRPARLSLTSISNLRDAANRVLSEPDPNGQVVLRPRGFPLFADLPSNVSTQSTSTRFSPFGESDDGIDPSSLDPPTSASSISPSSYIPSGLMNSLDATGGFDVNLSRSFQSEDDAVLARDWRKKAAFPRPLPVENPSTGMGMYTTSPSSLSYPSFDGVDKVDPFEVRPQPARRRFTSELELQRATLLSNRTISDPAPVPANLTENEIQDNAALAHRRWSSQQDAVGKERKGLNPEAKAFSLTKRSSLLSGPTSYTFDPLAHASSLSLPASLAPEQDAHRGSSSNNLFSSISMRAFAPSPAEREALKRALGGSTNTSLERLPTLSEVSSVSSIPSLSLPSSPSHSHAVAVAPPPGLAPSLGAAAKDTGFGFGNGRTILGPGIAWLQSLPRARKPKFSPWEDEETKELEAGGGQ